MLIVIDFSSHGSFWNNFQHSESEKCCFCCQCLNASFLFSVDLFCFVPFLQTNSYFNNKSCFVFFGSSYLFASLIKSSNVIKCWGLKGRTVKSKPLLSFLLWQVIHSHNFPHVLGVLCLWTTYTHLPWTWFQCTTIHWKLFCRGLEWNMKLFANPYISMLLSYRKVA